MKVNEKKNQSNSNLNHRLWIIKQIIKKKMIIFDSISILDINSDMYRFQNV